MAANVKALIDEIIQDEKHSKVVQHKEMRDTQKAYKQAGKKYKFNFNKELRSIPIDNSTPELESVVVNLFKLIRLGEVEGKEPWYRVLSDKNLVRILMQDYFKIMIKNKKGKKIRSKKRSKKL